MSQEQINCNYINLYRKLTVSAHQEAVSDLSHATIVSLFSLKKTFLDKPFSGTD